jgi:hypothetical protein
MATSGIRRRAFIAWLMLLLLAGASAWTGLQLVLLAMSHPGLATRQAWIGNVALLTGGVAGVLLSVVGLAREFHRRSEA